MDAVSKKLGMFQIKLNYCHTVHSNMSKNSILLHSRSWQKAFVLSIVFLWALLYFCMIFYRRIGIFADSA